MRLGWDASPGLTIPKWYQLASNKGANESQVRRQFEQKDREIKVLKSQVSQLKDQLDQMMQRMTQQPDVATLQTMLAGVMKRPTHMPQQAFDSQTAMINQQGKDACNVQKRCRPRPLLTG